MLTPFHSEVVPEGSINPRHFMLKQVKKYIGLFYLSKRQVNHSNVIPCAFLPNHASGLQKCFL